MSQTTPPPDAGSAYVPILGPLDERAEPRPRDEIIDRLACVMGRLTARQQWYDYGVVRDARQLLRAATKPDAAGADRARLDWLEKTPGSCYTSVDADGDVLMHFVAVPELPVKDRRGFTAKTVRQAIDAAMARDAGRGV